jgi:hypothetical protein
MQKYTKLEISIVELRRAKQCYLEADYVSATVLAGAARSIILNLCKHYCIKSTINIIGTNVGLIDKEINNLVSLSYNASKHADKDPIQEVEICAERVEALFALATSDLQLLNELHNFYVEDLFLFPLSLKKIY